MLEITKAIRMFLPSIEINMIGVGQQDGQQVMGVIRVHVVRYVTMKRTCNRKPRKLHGELLRSSIGQKQQIITKVVFQQNHVIKKVNVAIQLIPRRLRCFAKGSQKVVANLPYLNQNIYHIAFYVDLFRDFLQQMVVYGYLEIFIRDYLIQICTIQMQFKESCRGMES
eukprot:TRINITY_DN8189_c0_g1_i12.p3 TRINITY_DN8189_c0_g1~~TRINITY_DN8189_c0_g1_i12.p3  ORF type:complete len:168 (+),score=1.45 TRINITY_DN8189_c0_g1_i12:604-1107(+)